MPIYLYFFLIFLCIIPISISLKWQNTINTFLGKCAYLNWTVKKKGKCLSEFPWYAYAFLVSTGYLKICAVQMKRLVGILGQSEARRQKESYLALTLSY